MLKHISCSNYAQKTRNFNDQRVLLLRDELLSTHNPHELLYVKLPQICGTEDPKKLIIEFDKIYSELNEVYDQLIEEFKNKIINVFKSDPNVSDIDFETINCGLRKLDHVTHFLQK